MPDIPHPLPSEQLRRQLLAEYEAEYGVQWADMLVPNSGEKIYNAISSHTNAQNRVEQVADSIRIEHGANPSDQWLSISDALNSQGFGNPTDALDVIASVSFALDLLAREDEGKTDTDDEIWGSSDVPHHYDPQGFRDRVNDILLSYRIAWVFVGDHLVPRGDEHMSAAVVLPASEFLGRDPRWQATQKAYEKALTELGSNDPADAITDAATALQEMFRALGVDGASLHAQVQKARSKGVLTGWDEKLLVGLQAFVDWAEAERSNHGDAHHEGSAADKANAWLMVHVVGALILRLANETGRGSKRSST